MTSSSVRFDVRTRPEDRRPLADVATELAIGVPEAFRAATDRLRPRVLEHPPRPLTIDVDGHVVSLVAVNGDVEVLEGPLPEARTLHLSNDDFLALLADDVTPMGWLASGALRFDGRLDQLLDWWLLLRAALDGTTPHRPGDVTFLDGDGEPLEVARSFRLDDDLGVLATQLHATGFLHLRGVFTPEEMAAVSADMDAAAPRYRQGDGRSWWAGLVDGRDALVRMQGFDRESPAVARLLDDPRLRRLEAITGEGHHLTTGDNRIEALFKPLGVDRGISDIPWHKDCSLGRHAYMCSNITVGISVTGADARSGQLRVVAGSNRALVWPAPDLQPGLDLPVVDLPTETGDATLHLSCTLHMAQPPVDRERRVLYTSLVLPPLDAAEAAAGAARLRAIREAAPTSVSQPTSAGVGED